MKKRCFNCMKEYEEAYEVCPYCGYIEGTPPKEPYFLKPGEILNHRYIVGTSLDHGGFGIVYRAWDAQMEQTVAIKEYFPSGSVNRLVGERNVIVYAGKNMELFRKGVARYLVEARNMAEFSHPNIVSLYEYFEENNTAYIAMELLDGISLREELESKGPMDMDKTIDITLRVLDALSEVHSHNIIHRDISPDNIFLCSGDRVKIIDFGAARFSSGETPESFSAVVKPGYAPAEQYRTKSKQGPYSDLYAVGACMYHMLTGVLPVDSMSRSMEDSLVQPKDLNPDIPDYINEIILRAMAMDPEDRFQTAEEFSDALRKRKVTARKKKSGRKKKNRGWLKALAATVAVAALGCGLVWGLIHHSRLLPVGYGGDINFYVPESKRDYYEEIANKYRVRTKDESIKTIAIPDDQYEAKVKTGLEEKDETAIFLSDGMDAAVLNQAEDIREYLEEDVISNCYFLESYYKDEDHAKDLPMFFMVPFLIENRERGADIEEPASVADLALLKESKKISLYEVNASVFDQTAALNPDEQYLVENPDEAKFLSGKGAFYFTDWLDYKNIILNQGARMKLSVVYPAETSPMKAVFYDYVSISDQIDVQAKMEAEAFVNYMVSNQTEFQELLPDDRSVLPINKKAIDSFAAVWANNLTYYGNQNDGETQFRQYLNSCEY
ncbi:MAG: serine/threonine protein kinase [Eubacterium sp.]|nr:serine/threonine protein kinase [Eubacterium sp.]